jgi:hypothetical protein
MINFLKAMVPLGRSVAGRRNVRHAARQSMKMAQAVKLAYENEVAHVPIAIRKAGATNAQLVESYCLACGVLIGASPVPSLLDFVESMHACPETLNY